MKTSIRLKLIVLIAAVASIFTLIAVGLGGYLGINFMENSHVNNIRSHMQLASRSLQSPISRMDYLELQEQAELILEYKGISGIKILDQNNELILQKGVLEEEIIEKKIVQNKEKMGLLRVSFTNFPLQKGILLVLGVCALFILLGVPVFVFCVWYLSNKYLRDLSELTNCISRGNCENFASYPGETRKDEIGLLARTMRERDNELFAYNRELEEYKEQLEQKVRDRTRELARSKQLSETILNSMPEAIALIDLQDKTILDLNRSFLCRYDISKDEALNRPYYNIIQNLQADSEISDCESSLEDWVNHEPWVVEDTDPELDRKRYFELNILPVRNDSGTIEQIVYVSRDITQQKRTEELRNDVERIVRHDLKSPLNGIIGFSQLLLSEEGVSCKCQEELEYILNSGYKMLHMVNHSLDLFKMEEGTYTPDPEWFDLIPVLERIKKELAWTCERKSVQLELFLESREVDWEQSYYLWGEELNIYTVLANLIGNAVEASPPERSVQVRVETKKDRHIVEVHNYGVVPDSIRESFFERYATKGKSKGTGLGTYSAKLIVQAHGGSIDFTTSEQEGTRVFFSLPQAQS